MVINSSILGLCDNMKESCLGYSNINIDRMAGRSDDNTLRRHVFHGEDVFEDVATTWDCRLPIEYTHTFLLQVTNSYSKDIREGLIFYNKHLAYPIILKVVTNESKVKTTDPLHLAYIDYHIGEFINNDNEYPSVSKDRIISKKVAEVLYLLQNHGISALDKKKYEVTSYNSYTDLIKIVDNDHLEFDNKYQFNNNVLMNRPQFKEIYYMDGEECRSNTQYTIDTANGEYYYNSTSKLFHRKMYQGNTNLGCVIELYDVDENYKISTSNNCHYNSLIKLVATGELSKYDLLYTSSQAYKDMYVLRKSPKLHQLLTNRPKISYPYERFNNLLRSPLASISQNLNTHNNFNEIDYNNSYGDLGPENEEFIKKTHKYSNGKIALYDSIQDRRQRQTCFPNNEEKTNIQVVKLYYSKAYGHTHRPTPLYAITTGYDLRLSLYKEKYWPMLNGISVVPSHDSIHRLSPESVLDLIDGRYNYIYSHVIVVDCRFTYEYKAGHLRGALNYSKESEMLDLYYSLIVAGYPSDIAIVFHCEFSSHRAPQCALGFRSHDRKRNFGIYPKLDYPNIFVAVGGYKALYEHDPIHCIPRNYLPMLHEKYRAELIIELTEHDIPPHLFIPIGLLQNSKTTEGNDQEFNNETDKKFNEGLEKKVKEETQENVEIDNQDLGNNDLLYSPGVKTISKTPDVPISSPLYSLTERLLATDSAYKPMSPTDHLRLRNIIANYQHSTPYNCESVESMGLNTPTTSIMDVDIFKMNTPDQDEFLIPAPLNQGPPIPLPTYTPVHSSIKNKTNTKVSIIIDPRSPLSESNLKSMPSIF